MGLNCKGPSCDHEFDAAIGNDLHADRDAGAMPFFEVHWDPEDTRGIKTAHVCSVECMREFVNDVPIEELQD